MVQEGQDDAVVWEIWVNQVQILTKTNGDLAVPLSLANGTQLWWEQKEGKNYVHHPEPFGRREVEQCDIKK